LLLLCQDKLLEQATEARYENMSHADCGSWDWSQSWLWRGGSAWPEKSDVRQWTQRLTTASFGCSIILLYGVGTLRWFKPKSNPRYLFFSLMVTTI
jgi:hypothetical protein